MWLVTGFAPFCLEQVREERRVVVATRKIGEIISKPIVIQGHEIFVRASIGVTLFPKNGNFVRDIHNDPSDPAMVSSIISMGHGLDLTVIAEGVETPSQLNFLHRRNCDGYQGYYFSHPLPSKAISRLIQSRKTASRGKQDNLALFQ